MAYIYPGRNALLPIIRESSDRVLRHPLLFSCQGVRYRRLEVILTTKIDKLGNAGENVKFIPGYFQNHLMPKLLAGPNIEKYALLIREQRRVARQLSVSLEPENQHLPSPLSTFGEYEG